MCGIAGFISLGDRKLRNVSEVEHMLDIQNHRGPDDRGICAFDFQKENSFFARTSLEILGATTGGFSGVIGHNRLSILDLTDNGVQPMISPDRKVILAFNGEIYNAFDFKSDLKEKGYFFKSSTDTEIILYLYLEYGFEQMIRMLNGMFAIVIIDLRTHSFYMARDRFGIKPFYYSIFNNKISFASELKCLLCDSEVELKIDEQAVFEHMIYEGTDSKCLMKGVELLRPGQIIEYHEGWNKISTHYFFDVENYVRPNVNKSHKECKEELLNVLRDAIKSQMVSDVKVGCQMSGGIDSSLITTIASQLKGSALEDTVSIVFDKESRMYSEEKYMDIVQSKLKLNQHKFIIDTDYVGKNLRKTIWHLDTMASTANSIGIMLLSEEAKKYVTVLLSGEGSDEVFGGYPSFSQGAFYQKLCQLINAPIGRIVCRPFNGIYSNPKVQSMQNGYNYYATNSRKHMDLDLFSQVIEVPKHDASEIYRSLQEERITMMSSFSGSDFDRQLKYMLKTNLPDLLVRQDKMSMSASIENRVPFLDNRVVDFAFTLPERELLKAVFMPKHIRNHEIYEGKYILKDICSDFYGKRFAYRPKSGFGLPLSKFLQGEDFKEYFQAAILPGMRSNGLINSKKVETWYENIENINGRELRMLWKAINLQIWMELFLDKKGLQINNP